LAPDGLRLPRQASSPTACWMVTRKISVPRRALERPKTESFEVEFRARGNVSHRESSKSPTVRRESGAPVPLGTAVLHGGIMAWGRRPWLGLRIKDLFFHP
jgi:hypothetical protein